MQVPCQICGVSFNINRIRKPDEPFVAAWTSTQWMPKKHNYDHCLTEDGRGLFVSQKYFDEEECPPEAGCLNQRRLYDELDRYREESQFWAYEGSNDSADETYELAESEDEESLEYQSDADLLHDDDGLDSEYCEERPSTLAQIPSHTIPRDPSVVEWTSPPSSTPLYSSSRDFSTLLKDSKGMVISQYDHVHEHASKNYASARPDEIPRDEATETIVTDDADEAHDHRKWVLRKRLEHIAGPGCKHTGGYSGHEITVEEITGCTNSQCLVRKTADWYPEVRDQPFETDSNYYLTGLSGYMASTDEGSPKFLPVRHGVDEARPMGYIYDNVSFTEHLSMHFMLVQISYVSYFIADRSRKPHGLSSNMFRNILTRFTPAPRLCRCEWPSWLALAGSREILPRATSAPSRCS